MPIGNFGNISKKCYLSNMKKPESKLIRAISFARRSTTEQPTTLASQHEFNRLFALSSNIKIKNEVSETLSAWTGESVKLKDIFKQQSKYRSIDLILYQKVDRYSRNMSNAHKWIEKFRSIGIEINFSLHWVNWNRDGMLSFNILMSVAMQESDNTSMRTKQAQKSIKKLGYYVNPYPPKGFLKVTLESQRKSLTKQKGFEKIATCFQNVFHKGYSRAEMFKKIGIGLGFSKTQFYKIFDNYVYAGYQTVEDNLVKAHWYNERYTNIDEMLEWQKTKPEKQRGKTRNAKKKKYWAKGSFLSPDGRKMTAHRSKGNGGHYHYYSPVNGKTNGYAVRVEYLHQMIETAICSIRLKDSIKEIVSKTVHKSIEDSKRINSHRRNQIKKALEIAKAKSTEIRKAFLENKITLLEHREFKDALNDNVEALQLELIEIDNVRSQSAFNTARTIDSLMNLGTKFPALSNEDKTKLLQILFPEGFYLDVETNVVRTAYFNEQLLQMVDIQSNKKALIVDNLSNINAVSLWVQDGTHLEPNALKIRDIRLVKMLKEIKFG